MLNFVYGLNGNPAFSASAARVNFCDFRSLKMTCPILERSSLYCSTIYLTIYFSRQLYITPYIKCNCFYFEVKQLKCILNILKYTKWIFLLYIIYQSDMKIHLDRHEWANRRSLYIELNCSSTIYSGEKLG